MHPVQAVKNKRRKIRRINRIRARWRAHTRLCTITLNHILKGEY
jgi:hypothetical protein